MFFHIIVWICLAIGTFFTTRFAAGFFSTSALPEPSFLPNYTDGSYNTFWAEVYGSNASLRGVSFEEFIRNPQQYLHEKVLSLPVLDLSQFEPLLPAQKFAELETYLLHVDQDSLAEAKRNLSSDDFQELLETLKGDGKTYYQF